MNRTWLATKVFGALVAAAGPSIALSQSPSQDATDVAHDAGPVAADSSGESGLQEILVTGSRIGRKDYSSPSPIVTVGAEQVSQTNAVTLEVTLNQMPQFTAAASAADAGFPNKGGQAQLNLRGLGTNRSLILLDGRRIQPSNPDGTVDVNLIPTGLVSSIETITGGASAAYGSDAMSGVVNFLLNRKFSGFQIDAQSAVTSRGDGRTNSVTALLGGGFADDQGHATLSFNYADRDEVLRGARSFFHPSIANARLPRATALLNANPPSQAAVDALFESYGFPAGSVPRTAPFGTNADGTLFSTPGSAPVTNYKGPVNDQFLILNNSVLFNSGATYPIQMPIARYNLFADIGYQWTDNVEVYGQVLYTHYRADVSNSPVSLGSGGQNATVPATNPFIPDDLRSLLVTRDSPDAPFPITLLFSEFDPISTDVENDIYQFQFGLRGTLRNWTWDVYGSTGRTQTISTVENQISRAAVDQLLAAADGGASLCAGGFNPFGDPAALSEECRTFILREATTISLFKQNIVEATLQGGLFDLPAGEVRMAAGLNYRHDSYDHDPDAVWRSGDLQGLSAQFPSGGSHDVTEIFAEVLLPLVRNAPLMEKLDLDLGYRFSDYSTIGSVSTYKADVEWTIKPWAQLRGGYSRAIRAPSLGELFAPRTPATVVIGIASPTSTNGDPCDVRSSFRQGPNAAAVRQLCLDQGVPLSAIDTFTFTSVNIYADAVGNPDLEEEKADTYSVGLILPSTLETPWLSRLQFSVDYYSITIDDAIGRLPFATGLLRCFNGDGISNPTYDPNNVNCVVVARNAVGTITGGLIPTLNLASYETRGVDFQLDWAVPLDAFGAGSGDLRLHMVANRLLSFDLTSLPGAATLDYAGYSSSPIASNVLPKWKATSSLSFVKGGLNLGVRWRYIGATKEVSRLLTPTSTAPGPDAYNYFDLFGSFDVNDTLSIRGGVSNLTDKKPPQIGTALGNTDISTYDLLGTSFYLGLRATF